MEPRPGGRWPLREDLALSNAQELNEAVDDLEAGGFRSSATKTKIQYRGSWDISIYGEALKPIMAEKALEYGDRRIQPDRCHQPADG